MRSLLETAVKFSEKRQIVDLTHEVVDDTTRVIIESHGLTISSTAMPKFFDVFSIGETLTPGGDLGLGPAVAHRILSLFGGSVSVENLESVWNSADRIVTEGCTEQRGAGLLKQEKPSLHGFDLTRTIRRVSRITPRRLSS